MKQHQTKTQTHSGILPLNLYMSQRKRELAADRENKVCRHPTGISRKGGLVKHLATQAILQDILGPPQSSLPNQTHIWKAKSV